MAPTNWAARWVVVNALALAALLGLISTASATTIARDPLHPSQVRIVSVPAGTTKLHWAVLKADGTGVKYPWPDAPYDPSNPYYSPPAGYPVVDLLARGPSGDLERWAGRVTTGGKSPVEPPVEPPVDPPVDPPPPVDPAPDSPLIVGLDAGNYGPGGAAEVKGAVDYVRTEDSEVRLRQFTAAGLKMNVQFPGPYTSGGVCALNASAWVADALDFYRSNTNPIQAPIVEVLNEPGGTWFWGSNANSQANATCYRNLLQQTYAAFHARYGSAAPKILGTVDGSGGLTFGQRWWTASAAAYVDGIIVHPYGGTGNRASSALGNRQLIADAHRLTGEPTYLTEVGWPTNTGRGPTGDSLQWTEAEQAQNLTNFIAWARSTDYIAEVVVFNYRDYSDMWYGVIRGDGSRKPAYAALRAAG